MNFDILIRIRDQLAGLTRTREGFAGLNKDIQRTNTAASSSGGALSALSARFLGVSAVVAGVTASIRDFYRDIEEGGRTDAAAQGAQRLAQNMGLVRKAASETIGTFLAFGGEVANFSANLVPGARAAREAMVDADDSGKRLAATLELIGTKGKERLREVAEAAARAKEEQERLAQAARATETALLLLAAAWGEEAAAGKTAGERAVSLRKAAAELERLADSSPDREKAAQLRTDASRRRTQAATIESAIVDRLKAAEAERQRFADAQLSSRERLVLVEAEIALLARTTSERELSTADAQEQQANQLERITALERERVAINKEIADETKRAEEESRRKEREGLRNDLGKQVEAMVESLPTAAESAAAALATIYQGTTSTIYNALDGLWNKTMGLGDALQNVAAGFGNSMLRAIGDMASEFVAKQAVMLVKYVATKTAMFATDKAFSLKALALQAAQAAKSLVMWIPSAIAASISSFGTAGAIGLAAVVAALAAFGGFEDGGPTGGRRGKPAGVVHGEEFVFSAPAVDRLGVGRLSAMHDAALSGAAPVAAAPASGEGGSSRPQDVAIAIVDRQTSAEDFLNTSRGQRLLFDRYREFQRQTG